MVAAFHLRFHHDLTEGRICIDWELGIRCWGLGFGLFLKSNSPRKLIPNPQSRSTAAQNLNS